MFSTNSYDVNNNRWLFSNNMYIRIKKSSICFHKIDGQNLFYNSRKIHGIFLDDIIIYSTTFEEHICHIEDRDDDKVAKCSIDRKKQWKHFYVRKQYNNLD